MRIDLALAALMSRETTQGLYAVKLKEKRETVFK